MIKQKILDVIGFLPKVVLNNQSKLTKYSLNVSQEEKHISLTYSVPVFNQTGRVSQRHIKLRIPRLIIRNEDTFEVLGLLQAEMGKKQDGKIVFCNHEYSIINQVINWFDTNLEFPPSRWKWYIKVNINEPKDMGYRINIETKVINHWISKTKLKLNQSYPKRVSYIKNTLNKSLKNKDYGTLIIEKRCNLLSQIVKKLVNNITFNITNYLTNEARAYMKGIIAGEANIEINKEKQIYRVSISAKQKSEREIFYTCLSILGIQSKNYSKNKSITISKKENIRKILSQNLTSLSPEKNTKFTKLINCYKYFPDSSKI